MPEIAQTTEKKTLTLDELEAIDSNMILASVDTLHAQLKAINASARTIYVNSQETMVHAQKHITVAERLMFVMDDKIVASFSR